MGSKATPFVHAMIKEPSEAVFRGLRAFADIAEWEGQIDDTSEDHRAAVEWLKQHAGWRP